MGLVLAGCVSQQTGVVAVTAPTGKLQSGPLQIGALSGQRQRFGPFVEVNPDCSNAGTPVLKVEIQPTHGTVEFAPTSDYPYFPPTNVRSRCNDRKVDGLAGFYTSAAGYHGPDQFTVSRISPSAGSRLVLSYVVTVE